MLRFIMSLGVASEEVNPFSSDYFGKQLKTFSSPSTVYEGTASCGSDIKDIL